MILGFKRLHWSVSTSFRASHHLCFFANRPNYSLCTVDKIENWEGIKMNSYACHTFSPLGLCCFVFFSICKICMSNYTRISDLAIFTRCMFCISQWYIYPISYWCFIWSHIQLFMLFRGSFCDLWQVLPHRLTCVVCRVHAYTVRVEIHIYDVFLDLEVIYTWFSTSKLIYSQQCPGRSGTTSISKQLSWIERAQSITNIISNIQI